MDISLATADAEAGATDRIVATGKWAKAELLLRLWATADDDVTVFHGQLGTARRVAVRGWRVRSRTGSGLKRHQQCCDHRPILPVGRTENIMTKGPEHGCGITMRLFHRPVL